MTPNLIRRAAELSPCGTYRYTLTREWAPAARPRMLFVMLNPSTADHEQDDPTIRRCMGFARREGCGSLEVVNCFAYRSPRPFDLYAAGVFGADIVGPENRRHVRLAVMRADIVVCAWGAHGVHLSPVPVLVAEADRWCLGVTKSGAPKHPLYLRADAPLIRWPVEIP